MLVFGSPLYFIQHTCKLCEEPVWYISRNAYNSPLTPTEHELKHGKSQMVWLTTQPIIRLFTSALFDQHVQHSGVLKSDYLKYWSIWNLDFLKVGLSYGYSYSPYHSKTWPLKIRTFLSRFQMVFDKMASICPDFKWLAFRFSDPIQNWDHLQPNLFLTIQNPASLDFRYSVQSKTQVYFKGKR